VITRVQSLLNLQCLGQPHYISHFLCVYYWHSRKVFLECDCTNSGTSHKGKKFFRNPPTDFRNSLSQWKSQLLCGNQMLLDCLRGECKVEGTLFPPVPFAKWNRKNDNLWVRTSFLRFHLLCKRNEEGTTHSLFYEVSRIFFSITHASRLHTQGSSAIRFLSGYDFYRSIFDPVNKKQSVGGVEWFVINFYQSQRVMQHSSARKSFSDQHKRVSAPQECSFFAYARFCRNKFYLKHVWCL